VYGYATNHTPIEAIESRIEIPFGKHNINKQGSCLDASLVIIEGVFYQTKTQLDVSISA
jgi:hypothetical protein